MKRILYLTNVEVPYRVKFFNELARHCDLTVLYEKMHASSRDKTWSGSEEKLFKSECLNGISIKPENAFSFGIVKKIMSGYDTVIVGCYNSPVQIMAIIIMRIFKIKFYINADGETFISKSGIKNRIKKWIISGSTGYLCAGEVSAKNLSEVLDKKVTPYYFSSLENKEIQQNVKKVRDIEKYVLVVGQYVPEKGLEVALEAAKMDNTIKYKFIGTGNRSEQFILNNKIGEISNVDVIPFLNKFELEQEYIKCGCLVLPSKKECWGLVVNEAASYGTPIVSTWGSGAAVEFLNDKYSEYLVCVDDSRALYECIKKVLNGDNSDYSIYLKEKASRYSIENSVKYHVIALNLNSDE